MSAFHRSEFENKCALAPTQSLPALTLLRGFSLTWVLLCSKLRKPCNDLSILEAHKIKT